MTYRRACSSGVQLNEKDASVIKGMLLRGDRQHDIAAWFGVNGGRIAEISSGARFSWVLPDSNDLPPAGPYPSIRHAVQIEKALAAALVNLNALNRGKHL